MSNAVSILGLLLALFGLRGLKYCWDYGFDATRGAAMVASLAVLFGLLLFFGVFA